MALLTRAAARRQAADNGGLENGRGGTVPAVVRGGTDDQKGTNGDHPDSVVRSINSAINEDAVGGIVDKRVSERIKDSEANKASQQNAQREGTGKRSLPAVKPHKAAGPSRKGGNRKANGSRSARATPIDDGSKENETTTEEAFPCQKRKIRESDDPIFGPISARISQTHRSVRRRAGEVLTNERALRNATNSTTRPVVSSRCQSVTQTLRASEQGPTRGQGNNNPADDSESFPRFTRIQKGKYTEKEGDAADGIMELSIPRIFSGEEGGGTEQPFIEGTAFDISDGEEEDGDDESAGELDLSGLILLLESSSECRFEESGLRTTLTEED